MASYNSRVKLAMGKQIAFPDFFIEYLGMETVPAYENSELEMTVFYFILQKDEQTNQISWSSGTGDISPLFFEFNHENFSFEMQYSEKLNSVLADDEFVISKE